MAINNEVPIQLSDTMSKSDMVAYINENFRKVYTSLSPLQISDGDNNIVNIGRDSTKNYSIKVAKPGYDAFDAADANLYFNSNQNVLKVVQSGTATLTGGTANARSYLQRSVNIVHNLGYEPMFIGIVADSTGVYVPFPNPRISSIGIVSGQTGVTISAIDNYEMYIRPTLVYIIGYFYNGTNGALVVPDLTIKYYLLQETAT